jgi:hypothetical protein
MRQRHRRGEVFSPGGATAEPEQSSKIRGAAHRVDTPATRVPLLGKRVKVWRALGAHAYRLSLANLALTALAVCVAIPVLLLFA